MYTSFVFKKKYIICCFAQFRQANFSKVTDNLQANVKVLKGYAKYCTCKRNEGYPPPPKKICIRLMFLKVEDSHY